MFDELRMTTTTGETSVTFIIISVILSTIVAATIIGNLFVILAILLDKNLQTTANQLVLSLAVADLMVACLVMPLGAYNDIHNGWYLSKEVCEFWTSADVLCCTASILNLLAIAMDRYWAVTNVDYIYRRTRRRVNVMILCAWTVGAVVSLAPIFGWKDPDFAKRVIEEHKCMVSQDVSYQIFATISTFYAPLVLLLALYWRIFQVARKRIRRKPGQTGHTRSALATDRCGAKANVADPIVCQSATIRGCTIAENIALQQHQQQQLKCNNNNNGLATEHLPLTNCSTTQQHHFPATLLVDGDHCGRDNATADARERQFSQETSVLGIGTKTKSNYHGHDCAIAGKLSSLHHPSDATEEAVAATNWTATATLKANCDKANPTAGSIFQQVDPRDTNQPSDSSPKFHEKGRFSNSTGCGSSTSAAVGAVCMRKQDKKDLQLQPSSSGDNKNNGHEQQELSVMQDASDNNSVERSSTREQLRDRERDRRKESWRRSKVAPVVEELCSGQPSSAVVPLPVADQNEVKVSPTKTDRNVSRHNNNMREVNDAQKWRRSWPDKASGLEAGESQACGGSLSLSPSGACSSASSAAVKQSWRHQPKQRNNVDGADGSQPERRAQLDGAANSHRCIERQPTMLLSSSSPSSVKMDEGDLAATVTAKQLDCCCLSRQQASGCSASCAAGRHHESRRPGGGEQDVSRGCGCLAASCPAPIRGRCCCAGCKSQSRGRHQAATADNYKSRAEAAGAAVQESGEVSAAASSVSQINHGPPSVAAQSSHRDKAAYLVVGTTAAVVADDAASTAESGAKFSTSHHHVKARLKFEPDGRRSNLSRVESLEPLAAAAAATVTNGQSKELDKQERADSSVGGLDRAPAPASSWSSSSDANLCRLLTDQRANINQRAYLDSSAASATTTMSAPADPRLAAATSGPSRDCSSQGAGGHEADHDDDDDEAQSSISADGSLATCLRLANHRRCRHEEGDGFNLDEDLDVDVYEDDDDQRSSSLSTSFPPRLRRDRPSPDPDHDGSSLSSSASASLLSLHSTDNGDDGPKSHNRTSGRINNLAGAERLAGFSKSPPLTLVDANELNVAGNADSRPTVAASNLFTTPTSSLLLAQRQSSLLAPSEQIDERQDLAVTVAAGPSEEKVAIAMTSPDNNKCTDSSSSSSGGSKPLADDQNKGSRRKLKRSDPIQAQSLKWQPTFRNDNINYSVESRQQAQPTAHCYGRGSSLQLKRRFKAMGQLVSFVQTSRNLNSGSSSFSSNSASSVRSAAADSHNQVTRQPAAATSSQQTTAANINKQLPINADREDQQQHHQLATISGGKLMDSNRRQLLQLEADSAAASATSKVCSSGNPLALTSSMIQRLECDASAKNYRAARQTELKSAQRKQQQQRGPEKERTRSANMDIKREKKAAKTLAIITGVFVCCWLPFFLNAIIMPVCGPACTPSDLVLSVLLWLGYLNSLLNPIIYTIFSPDFRRAFRRLLCWPQFINLGCGTSHTAGCANTGGKLSSSW